MSLFSARWSAVHPDDPLATCPVEGWHGTHLKSAHITAHLSLSEPQSRSSEKKRQRFGHPSRSAMWDDFEGPSAFQGHNLLLSEWVRWLSSICHSSLDVQNPNAKGLTFFFIWPTGWGEHPLFEMKTTGKFLTAQIFTKESEWSVCMYVVPFWWRHVTQYTLFQFVLF